MRSGFDFGWGMWDASGMYLTNALGSTVTNTSGDIGNVNPNWDLINPSEATLFENLIPSSDSYHSLYGNGSINATAVVRNISVSYEDNELGDWRFQVSAQDADTDRGFNTLTNSDAVVDEFVSWDRQLSFDNELRFNVYDDDVDVPAFASNAWSRPLGVAIGASNVTGSADTTDAVFTVTDGDLAGVSGNNLADNWGFETGDFSDWTTWGQGWRIAQHHIEDVHSGTYGVVNDVVTNNHVDPFRGVHQDFPCSPGDVFMASVYIRAVSLENSQSYLELQFLDAAGEPVQTFEGTHVTEDQPFTLATLSATAPAGSVTASVRGVVWVVDTNAVMESNDYHIFDDFCLKKQGADTSLRLVFSAYDEQSGLSRGAEDATLRMNVSVGSWVASNVANYVDGESSADSTDSSATHTWLWNMLNPYDIGVLYDAGDSAVLSTIPDNDDDRADDRAYLVEQQFGYLRVIDDDEDGPVVSGITVGGTGGEDVYSGSLVYYDFQDAGNVFETSADATAARLTSGNLYSSPGNTAPGEVTGNPGKAAHESGWNVEKYFHFTIVVEPDFQMTVTNLIFHDTRSAQGPSNWYLRCSSDGYAADLATHLNTSTTWITNDMPVSISLTGTNTFRLAADNPGSARGTWAIDNLQLQGTISPLAGAGYVTDADIAAGNYRITATIQDAKSGVFAVDHPWGARYSIFNPNGDQLLTNKAFGSGPAQHGQGKSSSSQLMDTMPSLPYELVTLGTYTGYIYATDYDVDRIGDWMTSTQSFTFTVSDDDDDQPIADPEGLKVMLGATDVAPVADQTNLIAAWNFNDPDNRLQVSHGEGTLVNTASASHSAGTTVNAVQGDDAGQDITITGNGTYMQFSFSMIGHRNLVMSFAGRRSDAGHTDITVSHSINGGEFATYLSGWSATNVSGTAFGLILFDYTSVPAMNTATTVAIRIAFDGSTSGNTRLDNIQFNATPYRYFEITDAQLASVAAENPLTFSFNVYDAMSGIFRGSEFDGTNMHISVPGITTNDTANWQAPTISSALTTVPSSTSLWSYTSFGYEHIGALYADGASNRPVRATAMDMDDDRASDGSTLSNRLFGAIRVIDEDTAPPSLTSIAYGIGGVDRPFQVVTNGHLVPRSGTDVDTVFTVYDATLARPEEYDLQFAFGVMDTYSGISRGNTGATNTVLNFSIGASYLGDFANFSAALSGSNSTNAPTTNIWTFSNGTFSQSLIEALLPGGGTNPVYLTMVDDDNDRPLDGALTNMARAGFLKVIDDDTLPPLMNSLHLSVSTNHLHFHMGFDTFHGWTNSLGAYGTYVCHVGNDVWSGEVFQVTQIPFTPSPSIDGAGASLSSLRVGAFQNTNSFLTLPTQTNLGTLFVWARLSSGMGPRELMLEGTPDGETWTDFGTYSVTGSTNWQMFAWTVDQEGPLTLRLRRTGVDDQTLYLDDISLTRMPVWTNVTNISLSWGNAEDPSGVSQYRHVQGEMAVYMRGTNVSQGTAAATNTTSFTAGDGVNTGFVYAVDNDEDRSNDRLRSGGLPYVIKIDTIAPAQVADVVAEEGADNTSEIALSWNPLPDGGGTGSDPLSPWPSYVIYYTDEERTPTTNDYRVTMDDDLPELGTNTTSSVVLSNLIFDTTYRVAIAGRDRAGNEGPISEASVITLQGFYLTQCVARADSVFGRADLYWTAATNSQGEVTREYDLLYCDALDFSASLTSRWALVASGMAHTLADTGSLTRLPPAMLVNTMRFYRAAQKDLWRTNRNPRVASAEIYALKAFRLYRGQNWVSLPFVPDRNTVRDILGHELPGSVIADDTTTYVSWYEKTTGQVASIELALLKSGSITQWVNTATDQSADEMVLPLQDGFLVEIPTNSPDPYQTLICAGRLPVAPTTQTVKGARSFSFVQFNQPRRLHPSQMNLLESGLRGSHSSFFADRLRRFNPSTQSAEVDFYYNTAEQKWKYANGNNLPSSFRFNPGDAILIWTSPNTPDWNWVMPITYPVPTRTMTP
jgi:hypothetical protein